MTTTQTQTQARNHTCSLCEQRGATHTPDGTTFYCENATACLDRVQDRLEQTNYRDATPELYELFLAREALAKDYWVKCVIRSRDLKAALGLDDTSFLTHMGLMAEMVAGEGDEEC